MPDSLILLQDQNQSAKAVSDSILHNQPIQNQVNPGALSFYLSYRAFTQTHPHTVHIEARSGSDQIDYRDVDYTLAPSVAAVVQPNEFTYVDVTIPRNIDKTYTLYKYDPQLPLSPPWPPFPPGQLS